MKAVRDIPQLHSTVVLVRAPLNVPIIEGKVANLYRLERAVPTLKFLSDAGARVVVMSHIGEAGTETLKPVAEELSKLIHNVSFCETTIDSAARGAIQKMLPGQILVLENLRRNPREVKNDPEFAKELASLGDIFVEDSFDACHRKHASIVGVPTLLPSYAGLLLQEEIQQLTKALTPKSPSLAVIGGAKFSTKEPVLNALLKTYDKVFVGGALANDFLKAQGKEVGKSLVSGASPEQIKELLANPRLVLPIDTRVEGERIVDHGPGTEVLLTELVKKSKTVLWNGPLGEYEHGFTSCTDALGEAIAASGAYSIVGGGDTEAELEHLGILDRFSFVSTGGGAMLDFLAEGTLPGIQALG